MGSLDAAIQLRDQGQYFEALRALEALGTERGKTAGNAMKAELLERVGHHTQAEHVATLVVQSRDANVSERATCEYVLGRICVDHGDINAGFDHLQRASALAKRGTDLRTECWVQIQLTLVVSERSGPDAAAPLLAELRAKTIKLGDPRTTAAVHVFVGQMEAKRGLLMSARRHASIAEAILQSAPNLWLEAVAKNIRLAINILRSELDAAREEGARAVDLAERSGVAAIRRACLGNLGNLYQATGDFDRAIEYFERARRALPSIGEKTSSSLESLARVFLAQDRLVDCRDVLDRIDGSIKSMEDRVFYVYRHTELTRAHLLARQGRFIEAIDSVNVVLDLASRSRDSLLLALGHLSKAELLQLAGRTTEAIAPLNEAIEHMLGQSPELFAQFNRVVASALAREGRTEDAVVYYNRGCRIYSALQSVPGKLELDRRWNDALTTAQVDSLAPQMDLDRPDTSQSVGRSLLNGLVAVMLYPSRSELVAHELVELLTVTGCLESVTVTSRAADGGETVVVRKEGVGADPEGATQRLVVGRSQERDIEILLKAKGDIESAATVNAVTLLLSAAKELEQARLDRDERMTLWPVDELPIDGDGERSVISGHMRDMMNVARRVAKTNVNVLITGESGTGKEILARAVHDFSDRAQKPFVPFNCTAIPRDLLESQLFGHRRGAFTGADRDHAGLIRSAREGTLFLDEIGELGLDLQPKLLRFLESGEISPLGEPGPLTVNVRIIAATNANIEDAVRDGRFREDLFYRLNVVRLAIRPLRERRDEIPALVNHFVARAAHEFNKGPLTIAEETMERLLLYRWPGNVRQLQNELRRMVALAEPHATLPPEAISEGILGAMPIFRQTPDNGREISVSLHDKLAPTLARIECEMIKAAFREHHGKVDAVAKALGISRKGLYLKRHRLGL